MRSKRHAKSRQMLLHALDIPHHLRLVCERGRRFQFF
jgi:hypothetical protein